MLVSALSAPVVIACVTQTLRPAFAALAVLVALPVLPALPAPRVLPAPDAGGAALSAQTPEQRYADWTPRLGFRPQEYAFRRSYMIRLLRESGGGMLLVPSSDGSTDGDTFRQLEDFLYYTGLEVPNSMLVLDADTDRATLYLPSSDHRFENPGRPNDFPGRPLLDDYRLRSIAGVEEYRHIDELASLVRARAQSGRVLRVNAGAPGPVTTPALPQFGALNEIETLILRLSTEHPEVRFENAFEQTARMRMVKTRAEVDRMRSAADATSQAIRSAAGRIRPGATERSVQGSFEETCRALGSQSIPFTPIVKSGPNSLWPWRVLAAHYNRRNRAMEDGELVILDVGCEVDGYVSDVGRTFPVNGTFTPLQREKLLVSTSAADAIIAATRPGVTLRELTEVAYAAIPDHEEPFMQTPSFFGHHIGMSAGDPALVDAPLEPGMVFTVEPWYYNHELEIAVFVEDVVLVTEDGVEVLTAGLARTPDELESMIR
jgi:Xaa-Pro aminopeptidase